MLRSLPLLLGLLFLSGAAQARQPIYEDPELVPPPVEIPKEARQAPSTETPWIIRWLVHPQKRGLFINLPIMDTDPNRGITLGILPVWVIQGEQEDRITEIYAPSLTYNRIFKLIPTFRYFYYPAKDESVVVRGSVSTLAEREALVYYQNRALFGKDRDFSLRTQYNVDGSNHFFGVGPDTPKNAESDYTEDVLQYDIAAGVPLVPGTPWMIHLTNHFAGEKFYGGKISELPNITDSFPGLIAAHRQQVNESRLVVTYDSRDNATTTSQGGYLETYAGASVDSIFSAFDYTRYGLDGRYFYKWPGFEQVTAAQVKYEQLLGDAPFWLLPRMGGKYSLRAYGDGRYVDRGALVSQVEQRFTVYRARMAGVTTDFEVAPFMGLGSVFDNPQRLARRYVRPVVGSAVRAVARPQVVGSIDFGVGQEGLAVFMDINYSF